MTEHEKALRRNLIEDMYIQMRSGLTKDIKRNAAIGIIAELKGMDYARKQKQYQFVNIAARLYKEYIKEFDEAKND